MGDDKMRNGSTILVLAAAMVSLGGCQLFSPGKGNLAHGAQAEPDMASYFDQRMADGKRHLQANRLSLAITAYRQASYSPDHTVEAYNGLAIAFDRLGRRDLAAQYFNAALALAPEDEMIARNFARFEARSSHIDGAEMAVRDAQQEELSALSADQQDQFRAARFSPPVHGLTRTDDGGVALGAPQDTSSRIIPRENGRAAVVHVGHTTTPEVSSVDQAEGYPVRVQIAQASTEYPVRVQIGRSTGSSTSLEVRRGPPNGRATSARFSSPRG